jgi:hypothetical protein
MAVAVYRSVCAVTCFSFSAMRWYASFRGCLMKKGMSDKKLRRDLWLSLCFALLYIAGVVGGFFFPSSVCSYTLLFRRHTPSADLRDSSARSTRDDRRLAMDTWSRPTASRGAGLSIAAERGCSHGRGCHRQNPLRYAGIRHGIFCVMAQPSLCRSGRRLLGQRVNRESINAQPPIAYGTARCGRLFTARFGNT